MVEVSSETFDTEVKAGPVVVVKVWGPKCRYCLALMPQVETLAKKYAGEARIVKLDAAKNRNFCLGMKVASLPTFLFFRNGTEVERLSGSKLRIEAVEAALKNCIPQRKASPDSKSAM